MRKILESCPACEGEVVATELGCTRCGTRITGHFRPSIFDRLPANDLRFIEIFVKNKGNVKDMERELGLSYWTIRNRLNEVIERLGFEGEDEQVRQRREARRTILAQLQAGEISVQDAATLLAQLRSE